MAEGIPRDFDESWPHSDVILITENSGGKVLYANRAVLSVFSPVMAAMFSHNFKEANQESVEIHVDYEAMKEILRIIFQINLPTVLNPQKTYDTAVLMEIYKAADFLDFRSIRQLCVDQIRSISSVDVAVAALELDLHDILMEILGKMSLTCVKTFLVTNNTRLFFSRRDLAILFKKLYCSELTQEKESSSEVLKLEEIAPDVENPRIDLTKKWFASNVAFMTENSAERILYANKGTLASVSEHFRELFFDEKMLFKQFEEIKVDNQDCGRDYPLLKLPYEYATMKTILTIIHHCNADYTAESSPYNPALLYDMYCVASKGRLDMPNIQNMCISNLLKQPTIQSLEVAIRLNLDIKAKLMEKMSGDKLMSWLRYSEGMLVYRNVDKEVEISARQSDHVLSLNDIRTVVEKLKHHPIRATSGGGFVPIRSTSGGGFGTYGDGLGFDGGFGCSGGFGGSGGGFHSFGVGSSAGFGSGPASGDRAKNNPRDKGGRGVRGARRNADTLQ